MLKVNQVYHGFRLVREETIREINSVGRLFLHEKSGARLLNLENEDDNKVFAITFRTPPSDSTGVPHILEHSVLCGSRKFPAKEPFVELAKGSLNTFLNAFTFPDKTMYPVASKNDKDFRNLMDVYLDAVFYPNIYQSPEILMQEGWHYELEDPGGEIAYRGVVYNEMKGAFSSPESLLFRKIKESLFPDTPYGFESGGDPDHIPELTYEQFIAFHRKYYHPSNSYLFLYGKMNLLDQLKFLDEEYLRHFERTAVDSAIPLQQPFAQPRELRVEYPITPNEKEEEKAFLALNFAVGRSTDPEIYLAFDILEHLLLETPAAPLKKALLEAGLGRDVFGYYESGILQPTFSVVVKNTDESRKERFREIVFATLKHLAAEGIDKKLVEASINIKEFQLREADTRHYPKGLVYGITVMDSWLYDGDPFLHLRYEPVLARLKEAMASSYFEGLIERCLLDNPHTSLVAVTPKKGLAEKKEAEVRKKLAEYKATLSDEAIRRLVEETRRLKERQAAPDSPEALRAIPLLSLADIQREAEVLPLEEREESDVKVLAHPFFTNQITYLNLYFDARTVEQGLLPYVALLAGLLGKISTGNLPYGELANEINLHTGGIQFAAEIFSHKGTDQEVYPKLTVKGKALTEKLPKLFELLGEILASSRFDEPKRLKEVIDELKSRMEMAIFDRGHVLAAGRALSYFSPAGKLAELFKGLTFYHFIADLSRNFDGKWEEIRANLERVRDLLFNRGNLLASVTGDAEDYRRFQQGFPILLGKLGDREIPFAAYRFDFSPESEGLVTSGKVQYVAKACNFVRLGHSYKGSLQVLRTILSLDYLWNRVRVQGGAYGAFAHFDRSGNMYFTSYRDPNLTETLAVYDGAAQFLEGFAADEREMAKYIIGTVSRLDTPLSPSMKGERAAANYISRLTQEEIQREREEVLATKPEEIRAFASLVADAMKQNYLCVLGNEEKIKENRGLFNRLVQVFE